jgi:hypothetical protein
MYVAKTSRRAVIGRDFQGREAEDGRGATRGQVIPKAYPCQALSLSRFDLLISQPTLTFAWLHLDMTCRFKRHESLKLPLHGHLEL